MQLPELLTQAFWCILLVLVGQFFVLLAQALLLWDLREGVRVGTNAAITKRAGDGPRVACA